MSGDNKIKQFIKNNFLYFAIALVCVAYIAYGLVKIKQSGKTILEIIGSGIIIFIVAYLISLMLSLQGMLTGDRKDEVINTNKLHSKCVSEVDPKINEMDDWCDQENSRVLKQVRKQILNRGGLRYSDCFEDDGTAKEIQFERSTLTKEERNLKETDKEKYKVAKKKVKFFNKQQKLKEQVFQKAIKVKITPITTAAITASAINHSDPNNLGMDRRKYQRVEANSSLLLQLTSGIIFSYFTFSLVFGWENLITAFLQVTLFLLMGSIKFVQSYYFVTEDLRKRTVRQINYLQRFKCDRQLATIEEVAEENKILNNEDELLNELKPNTEDIKGENVHE